MAFPFGSSGPTDPSRPAPAPLSDPSRMPGGQFAGMSAEEAAQIKLMQSVSESCPFKLVLSGAMGTVLGGAFGIFTSAMRYDAPATFSPQPGAGAGAAQDWTALPFRQQVKLGLTDTARSAWTTGKNFGMVGAVFAGSECCIEAFRAKNDAWNGIAAGAFTGGVLARKAGPRAAAVGAAGFALFSVGIEWYMRLPEDEKRFPVE